MDNDDWEFFKEAQNTARKTHTKLTKNMYALKMLHETTCGQSELQAAWDAIQDIHYTFAKYIKECNTVIHARNG